MTLGSSWGTLIDTNANSVNWRPYFSKALLISSWQNNDISTKCELTSRIDIPSWAILVLIVLFRLDIMRPLKYSFTLSAVKECIVPIRVFKKTSGLITLKPYCPYARTGTMILYLGSSSWMGVVVPHFKSILVVRLMYQTSALKGELLPKGRLIILFRSGMFSVFRVYVPASNWSYNWPPFTKKATWVG